MRSSYPAMYRIVRFMNMRTDHHERLELAQESARVGQSIARKTTTKEADQQGRLTLDSEKIALHGLTFQKKFVDVDVSFEQGKLYGVTGPPGSGSRLLLKLLSQVLL